MMWQKIGNIRGPIGQTGDVGPVGPQGLPGIIGIQRQRLLANGLGIVNWTFPNPFPQGTLPRVLCIVESADPQPYVCNITALSNTEVTVQIWHSRTLPLVLLVLSTLAGFNIFDGVVLENTPVHIIALPEGD